MSGACDLNGSTWGLFIDGKDASYGEHAYGLDFALSMSSALATMNENLDDEISFESIVRLHDEACPTYKPIRGKKDKVMHELSTCFLFAEQELKQDILKDLPASAVDVHRFLIKHGIRWMGARQHLHQQEVKDILKDMIDKYNFNIRKTSTNDVSKRIVALAQLLRSLAWLHPFTDCNGRTRVILLQKELRRLGLGCGAMMFNNNADIYVTPTDRYVAKIQEGIQMAARVLETGSNPWHEEEIQKHLHQFPVHKSLNMCRMKFGKQKSIKYKKQGSETEFSPID